MFILPACKKEVIAFSLQADTLIKYLRQLGLIINRKWSKKVRLLTS
jgi:hypothetical protein